MIDRIRQLPSPALAISVLALVVAVGGGTFAIASSRKSTTKIVTKIVRKLAPKLSVNHAKTADHATNADHAGSADSATTAGTVSDGAVTTAKLGADAVTGAKVKDGSLTGSDLAAETITGSNLDTNSVSSDLGLQYPAGPLPLEGEEEATLYTHTAWTLTAVCKDDGGGNAHAEIKLTASSTPLLLTVGNGAGARFTGGSQQLVATPSSNLTKVQSTNFIATIPPYSNHLSGQVLAAVDFDDPSPVSSPHFCWFAFDGAGR